MKRIAINEAQLKRLFVESDEDAFLDGDDTTKKLGANASTSPNSTLVTNDEGDEVFGNPIATDRFAGQQSNQMYSKSGRRM